ncbi:hypothetical protein OSTOST_07934 [Ostertagia ostertagi]
MLPYEVVVEANQPGGKRRKENPHVREVMGTDERYACELAPYVGSSYAMVYAHDGNDIVVSVRGYDNNSVRDYAMYNNSNALGSNGDVYARDDRCKQDLHRANVRGGAAVDFRYVVSAVRMLNDVAAAEIAYAMIELDVVEHVRDVVGFPYADNSYVALLVHCPPLGSIHDSVSALEGRLDRYYEPRAVAEVAYEESHESYKDDRSASSKPSPTHGEMAIFSGVLYQIGSGLSRSIHVAYIDGGYTNNLPDFEDIRTITISPFSGNAEISPTDEENFFDWKMTVCNQTMNVNLQNIVRGAQALFPPARPVLESYYEAGFKDAFRFLIKHDIIERNSGTAV